MFVNYSHHPSSRWSPEQREAAAVFGPITDMPFINVPPDATAEEVRSLAAEQADRIVTLAPAAVLCQGEMTFTYHLVRLLKEQGIRVVCATTQRISKDVVENGQPKKLSQFIFVQFRDY